MYYCGLLIFYLGLLEKYNFLVPFYHIQKKIEIMNKRNLLLVILLLLALGSYAQPPQKMSYQSVVRNAANQILADQSIGVKISIIEGSFTGTVVYTETHTATTNASGLFTLEAGGGTPTTGTFAAINWGNGSHYIKSEIDVTGGTNYALSGTMELLSVPYALYAAKSGNASLINTTTEPAGGNCANGGTKIEVGLDANNNGVLENTEVNGAQTKYVCNGTNTTGGSGNGLNPGDLYYWSGSAWNLLPIGTNGQNLIVCNGKPIWGPCVNPSTNGTSVISSMISCNTSYTGSMALGVDVIGVSQTITVNVTTAGNYDISATANGVTFSATGTFTSTGNQNVILSASGVPTLLGTNSFVLNTTPNCSFDKTIVNVAIGQPLEGGVIAYVDNSGKHGLIVAPMIQSTSAEWGCNGTELSGGYGRSIGSGNQNTIEIMNGCSTAGIAARICGDFVLDGYSDWYLPSKDELIYFYNNRAAIGGFGNNIYWTSSQNSSGTSWVVDFNWGNFTIINKNYSYAVRAVRSF
ncbi:MAG: hypothetical protein CFE24_14330 [Flavobacterium sp. BFFFF2]|nr:MAG: hypothetical protein CFE24_14330 [Flavobacterium sp. BFFFF2]